MDVDLDTIANALFLRITPGPVVDHREIADFVVGNFDDSGALAGIEFVHAEDFGPFLLHHSDLVALPPRLPYLDLETGISWSVATGSETRSTSDQRAFNTSINGAFIDDLLARPWLIERIPDGAVVIPLRVDSEEGSSLAALELARLIARQGGTPMLHLIGLPSPEQSAWQPTHHPQLTIHELTPRWYADPRTTPLRLHYYPELDLLVANTLPDRDALSGDGRVVPIRDRADAILLVDLDSQLVVGRLVPQFRASVVPRLPAARSWLDQAEIKGETPAALAELLEDLRVDETVTPPNLARETPSVARAG